MALLSVKFQRTYKVRPPVLGRILLMLPSIERLGELRFYAIPSFKMQVKRCTRLMLKDSIKAERYKGWTGALGEQIAGSDLATIADLAVSQNLNPRPRSGQQERIENIITRVR